MGINFSRALTLKYSYSIKNYLNTDKAVVSVGRVMTCVLGMVVNREREIREFVKIPFYRILMKTDIAGHECSLEWKAVEGSKFYQSPKIYKDNGFLEEKDADDFLAFLQAEPEEKPLVEKIERKKETKNPPLLYNLAELQNDCSKLFKISPDETLRIAQELYEKKLTTYPRTDARVLSTAVSKEIGKNIRGLQSYPPTAPFAERILKEERFKGIAKTRYVNDKQITDHYAIIPTGQGLSALNSLHPTSAKVYEIIARRFLSVFYPAAVYQKITLSAKCKGETFVSGFKVLAEQGYLEVAQNSFARKRTEEYTERESAEEEQEGSFDVSFMEVLGALKKGAPLDQKTLEKKVGETSPPKRYNSGTMILTMENAGQFIEDEELRAQIKGSGIGTSATRAEILKKLVHIKYLDLNKKTQIITPTLLGEMIYEVVAGSVKPLLDPRLTASWEKGLTLVASGEITEEEYMGKLDDFVTRRTNSVKQMTNQNALYHRFQYASQFYKGVKKEKG